MVKIERLINQILHRRSESEPSLADSLDDLDSAVQEMGDSVNKLSMAIEDLILIADRPLYNQDIVSTAKTTMHDAVKMLDKMKYLEAPDTQEPQKAQEPPNTQPSATNRITPLLPGSSFRIDKDWHGVKD